jgi:hypothetical protein
MNELHLVALWIVLIVAIVLFLRAILSVSKEKKGWEVYLKPLTFVLFTIVLFFTYRIGLVEEGSYTNPHSINFVAFTAAIKVYTGEYRGDLVEVATNNSLYVSLLYTASITGFLFVFYTLFGVIIRLMTNNMRLKYYRNCKNIYIFGEDDKINTFLESLRTEKEFRFPRLKFFFPFYTKVIIVMPKDKEGDFVLVPSSIRPAFIYSDVTQSILQNIININNHHHQRIVSLYEDDESNAKLIGSLSKIIETHYLHFSEQKDHRNLDIYQEKWMNYNRLKYEKEHHKELSKQDVKTYRKLHHEIRSFNRKHFNINGHIHYMDLDGLNLLEMRMNLKNRVDFYSQNGIVAYNYVFDHPVMMYKNQGKQNIHYILVGFGLTNRNILRHLIVNNIVDGINRTYTCISNDKRNTLEHFNQKINILDFEQNPKHEYLPEIDYEEIIGNISFKPKLDVTKKDFILYLDKIKLKDYDQINFIVALGRDILNIDVAHKLLEYTKHRSLISKTQIDLRITDNELDITALFGNEGNTVNSFGKYCDVYAYDNIISKEYLLLAKGVHEGMSRWTSPFTTTTHMNRMSSLAAALSIRNKLLTMGFDLTLDVNQKISSTDYYHKYFNLNDTDELQSNIEKKLESIQNPATTYNEAKKYYMSKGHRHDLGVLEHERWNAFKVLDGCVPMSLTTFLKKIDDNASVSPSKRDKISKNEFENTHICLTNNTGLVTLAKHIQDKNKEYKLEDENAFNIDYIFYDYVMMDKLPEILEDSAFYICHVQKEDNHD